MVEEFIGAIHKVSDKLTKKDKDKIKRVRNYRKEVSRRASMANKRLDRLRDSGMTSSPAYQSWLRSGGKRFSIRGKNYNEVQEEMARVNAYLDKASSSVTGAKKVVNELAKTTGMSIDWKDWQKSREQTANFFKISSQVEQYLRTAQDRASAIGYQKIWEAVNSYIEEQRLDLDIAEGNIEDVTQGVIKAMKVWDEEDEYEISDGVNSVWGVSKLGKKKR